MKNNLLAVFAAAAIVLAGCAEKSIRDNSDEETAENTSVSAADMTDSEKLERYEEFYDSIQLECNTGLAEEAGGIMKLSERAPEKSITYAESMTKELVEQVKNAENYRILYADTNVKMETAVKGEKMKISICSPQSVSSMLFNGSAVNSFFPLERDSVSFTLSDEDMASYSSEALLDSTLYYPDNDSESVRVSTVSADGDDYVCEVFDGFAYLFDNSGAVAMFCDGVNNFTARIETENISDSVFVFPEWYMQENNAVQP